MSRPIKPQSKQAKPASRRQARAPSTSTQKPQQAVRSVMDGRHRAVYHRSSFSLSSDLDVESESGKGEATMCRICQSTDDSMSNQQVTPCACAGTLRFVHMTCLRQWRQTKQAKGLDARLCELCKQPYNSQLLGETDVAPDNLLKLQEDLKHLVRSGIYLMLLMRSWKDDVIAVRDDVMRQAGSEEAGTSTNPEPRSEAAANHNHPSQLH